nr:aromatic amino acid lyase [Pontibacter sp. BAB1700]
MYQQGSLGASGDLAPLAHLCLPLIGLGEVYYQATASKAAMCWRCSAGNRLHCRPKKDLLCSTVPSL